MASVVLGFCISAIHNIYCTLDRAGRAARAGRKGSALSLVTSEELPYVLDLHLFLSRPVRPAPVTSVAEAAAAAKILDPSISLLGSFPQVYLQNLHLP